MPVATADRDVDARLCAYADPAIKLFGRDIPLTSATSNEASEDLSYQDIKPEISQAEECNEPMDVIPDEPGMSISIDDGNGSLSMKKTDDDTQIIMPHCIDGKGEESQGPSAVSSHEKMPKKPDKLIPCPRCHSLDTKFCYFNNYNVNQPRHFCRKCQRYWTAGGTLRNVPVGAGRRKHKHSISHQKHVMVADTIPVRSNSTDMAHHKCSGSFPSGGTAPSSPSKPMLHVLPLETHAVSGMDSPSSNGMLFSFGQESPLCKSMAATTLSMRECGAVQNQERFNANATALANVKFAASGKQVSEHEGLICNTTSSSSLGHHDVPAIVLQNGVGISCPTIGSPVMAAATLSQEGQLKVNAGGEVNGRQVSEAGYTNYGGVWQPGSNMMLNTAFNPAAANVLDSANGAHALPPTNMLASCNGAPGSLWTGFPWPLMNPAMWGPPVEWASPWTMPFCPPAAAAAAAAALFPFSGAGSALAKPQPSVGASQPEKCLWVPKTLRINDPLDAARSSIWTTLGLGDGPSSSPVNGSTKAFRVKAECKHNNEAINSQQHSNPAASSRSAAFHENS